MTEIANDPARGQDYWRSLQELADSDEFRRQLENEFPAGVEAPPAASSRRRFLQIMAASVAMAGLAGCRWPEEKIVPFAKRPDGYVPGVPRQFATAMELGGVAPALLVTSYDGRPIKIDGNPDHPCSLAAPPAPSPRPASWTSTTRTAAARWSAARAAPRPRPTGTTSRPAPPSTSPACGRAAPGWPSSPAPPARPPLRGLRRELPRPFPGAAGSSSSRSADRNEACGAARGLRAPGRAPRWTSSRPR